MSESESHSESEDYRKSCMQVEDALRNEIKVFKGRSRRHKRWHERYSLLTVFGGVIGPTLTAYILAGNNELRPEGWLTQDLLNIFVIVIAAMLGAVGSAQRIFAFGTKYVTSARGLIELEDAKFDLSAKLAEWNGKPFNPTQANLSAALRRAQDTLKKTRRSYLLAEMNIVEESRVEALPQSQQNSSEQLSGPG